MRKGILVLILFIFLILASGCETVKGVGTGVCAIGKGIGDDAKGFWNMCKKGDSWMKENLW